MVAAGETTLLSIPVTQDGMSPKTQEFTAILEKHRGERHLVVLHDFPDPDALSAAFAHRLISAEYGIDVDITYSGKISHSQNIALVKLLGIDLIPFDEKKLDLTAYQGVAFLDHQGASENGLVKAVETAGIPVLIVVDHHALQEGPTPEYSDIRKVGSTASIYTQYIEQGLLNLQKTRKEHVAVATALTHGILTDTEGFIKADAEDFAAAAYLSQLRDADLLEHIMNQARSKQVMDVIRRALGNRMVVENVSIAGIGYLRADDRDAIPQAAEFLVKEENVHTSIVYGIIRNEDQEEALSGSLRTSKLMLDPDEFLKSVFGTNREGHHYGGGKHMAGGFTIPIGFLTGNPSETYSELKWQVFDAQVKAKLFARIGVKQG
jgi:nanoRNase/pAp phosphatase (c-di-AMP/oligoRNAs hydrolase)